MNSKASLDWACTGHPLLGLHIKRLRWLVENARAQYLLLHVCRDSRAVCMLSYWNGKGWTSLCGIWKLGLAFHPSECI